MNNIEACYIRPLVYLGYGEMGLNPLPSRSASSIAVLALGHLPGRGGHQHGVR